MDVPRTITVLCHSNKSVSLTFTKSQDPPAAAAGVAVYVVRRRSEYP